MNNSLISIKLIKNNHFKTKSKHIIIECCGGWRHLLNQQTFYSDWVIQEKIPVILVVSIQPGCINHATLKHISLFKMESV